MEGRDPGKAETDMGGRAMGGGESRRLRPNPA